MGTAIHEIRQQLQAVQDELQEVRDRQRIHEVLMDYNRGIDRQDEELAKAAFHPDAVDHHGSWFHGNAWEGVHTLYVGDFAECMVHMVTNESISLDGDVAYTEQYLLNVNRISRDGKRYDFTFIARFLDRLERRDGDWRIAERQVVEDLSRIDEVARTEMPDWPDRTDTVLGTQTKEDPVYALFGRPRGMLPGQFASAAVRPAGPPRR